MRDGTGSGRSDIFQMGFYGRTQSGPAYLAAGLAFAEHWLSTTRSVQGTNPTASFLAESYAARLEAGYRLTMGASAVTPYGALQTQNFHTPDYAEAGSSTFGLNYNAKQSNDTRSELGLRLESRLGDAFTLHARAAWAHDWMSDPAMIAALQGAPSSSFVINGVLPGRDAALVSGGATFELAKGVSLMTRVGGEFATHSSAYDAKAEFHVAW
jgi:outer membrane autotransporter protein